MVWETWESGLIWIPTKYFEPITPIFMLFHLENKIVFLLYGKILLALKKFTKNHALKSESPSRHCLKFKNGDLFTEVPINEGKVSCSKVQFITEYHVPSS